MDLKPEDTKSQWSNFTFIPFVVFLAFVFSLYMLATFVYPPNNPPAIVTSNSTLPVTNCKTILQLVMSGKPIENKEAKNFLVQIKNDLKTDKEVIVLEGYYWLNCGILAMSFPELEPDGYSFSRYYILIDSDFYKNLNGEEKKAVVAHEMGHIHNIEEIIRGEIEADNFALKYVTPQTLIDLLNTIPDKRFQKISKEYKLRIENLENIRNNKNRH